MTKLHAIVSGRVQGVGFRYFVQRQAIKLGLKGWVKNREDGKVEVLAFGEEENINKLLTLLHQGPSMSFVEKVDYTKEKVNSTPYNDFFIAY
ncbi:MAG: acylphosphatase [Brevinematia bacterium]